MKIVGPLRYRVIIKSSQTFEIISPESDGKIHGKAAERQRPKLYVISHNKKPIYVGITKQNIRNRLRMGFQASGKGGYYGYSWRKYLKQVDMNIWCDEKDKSPADIEAIEAELVFLIRKYYKQWPKYQTEIHFHQSNTWHKKEAKNIFTFIKNPLQ